MKRQLWYKIRIRLTDGTTFLESVPQVVEGAGVTEAQLKEAVDGNALAWDGAGLFDMGADEDGDRCLVNAQQIAILWVIWLPGPPEDATPPAGEVAGGAGIAADYAESAE